ncbi:MAG TPA: universal stress protein [Methanoregulaceae archaeon]|nr:MAG: universal stress protein [Methanolinea sp.]HON80931.1 universal stress protein [Methanoregulaceae archaeon]HPD09669.1 universal stress protein [Methanoregulaceae archaeon]HRT15703.1 universal stress protein [Methanoregulaceae archaeon]HRU31217.1 universal stress protein [Methanoregulaceae archaeon]
MFQRVLFATDFSEYAKKALDCVAGFPGVKEIILLHILEEARSPRGGGEIHETLTPHEMCSLREEKNHLEKLVKDLKVTIEVRASSDTAGAILETAEEKGVPLIVVGARGSSIVEGILLGSVSMAIIRRSKMNVLVMRHKITEGLTGKTYEMTCPMILSRILCPIDFSPSSDTAINLLKSTKGIGEIILLNVVSRGETEDAIKSAVKDAERQLEAAGKTLSALGITVRTVVKIGDPGSEIVKVADDEGVSVIWISSRGKGWFRELLLGSTAHSVAVNAKQPVIIIRTSKTVETNPGIPV